MDAPKCKLCGHRHWAREPHKNVTKTVTDAQGVTAEVTLPPRVTDKVTVVSPRVTIPVTEEAMIQAALSPEHECPLCGALHKRPLTAAEKQKAYRERLR